jgi:hypothetical protein
MWLNNWESIEEADGRPFSLQMDGNRRDEAFLEAMQQCSWGTLLSLVIHGFRRQFVHQTRWYREREITQTANILFKQINNRDRNGRGRPGIVGN